MHLKGESASLSIASRWQNPQCNGAKVSDPKINRLLDAASNRASEAVRVVEDIVRFIFDDHILTEHWKDELKSLPFVSHVSIKFKY